MLKIITTVAILASASSFTSHAGMAGPNPLPEPLSSSRSLNDDEKAVQRLLESYYEAFDRGNTVAMRSMVLEPSPFTLIESGSLDSGWGNYQENHLKPEMKMFDKTRYTVALVQLYKKGDSGYAVYRATLDATMGEKSGSAELLGTAMLVKSLDRWYLQHIHTSAPGKHGKTAKHEAAGAHDGHTMKHAMRDLTNEPNIPGVALTVTADAMSGWNLSLTTKNFRFAPEKSGGGYEAGTGHAHLYVNGKKIGRIYSNWYHLNALPSGDHKVTVTLNGNDHSMLMMGGKVIGSEVIITQQ